jgi:hypothetical protein
MILIAFLLCAVFDFLRGYFHEHSIGADLDAIVLGVRRARRAPFNGEPQVLTCAPTERTHALLKSFRNHEKKAASTSFLCATLPIKRAFR